MDHMVIGAVSLGESNEFEKEANLSLSDRLKVFKTSQFDAGAFINSKCRNMAEKELKHLTIYLKEIQKASAEEMRKSVYANYSAFIRTAKEISLLEGQLLSLRNLLSAQAAVVHGLADGVHVNSLSPSTQGPSDEDMANKKNSEFYLDMEFVMLFASQGRFLSRNLQQVAKNIIARAIDAVSASGIDPYSSLPEDEWFVEVAQMALKMLTGNSNFGSEEREDVSPTTSVSERSI